MNWKKFITYIKEHTTINPEILEYIASLEILRLFVCGLSPETITYIYNDDISAINATLENVFGALSSLPKGDADLSFYSIFTKTFEVEYFIKECLLLSPYYSIQYLERMFEYCMTFYEIERKVDKFYE